MSTQDVAFLQENRTFQSMPERIRDWIAESPNATADFAEFFRSGGKIEASENVRLPYYSPEDPPKIVVNQGQWNSLQQSGAPEWPQRHLFGTLAHEIGHDRFNTGAVPFTCRVAEEYVQYRSGLEAQAIFNAFPIFKDLERNPAFSPPPFESIGYLNPLELGQTYKQWRAGELDDKAVVDRIAAQVPDRPYTLGAQLQDQNADGQLTHRDLYLRDYAQYVAPKLEPQASRSTPDDPNHPDHKLLEKIREGVRGLDQQQGKAWSEDSERLSASLLVAAKQERWSAQDDIQMAFSRDSEKGPASHFVHMARTGTTASVDPAANRASVVTDEARAKPAEESYQQVQTIAQQQELERQQTLARGPDDPSRGGPVMR